MDLLFRKVAEFGGELGDAVRSPLKSSYMHFGNKAAWPFDVSVWLSVSSRLDLGLRFWFWCCENLTA
jgi:hypothetical protein